MWYKAIPAALPALTLVFFLNSAPPGIAQSSEPPASESLEGDLEQLERYFPRLEGSPNEGEILAFIEKRLQDLGVAYQQLDFSESDRNHSFSSCLEATIPGKLADTLVLALPINHPSGAEKEQAGSVNIALGLSVLGQLQAKVPPVTVKVLFLGAEFGETPDYPMGSKLFLRDFYPEYRVMVLYLNLKAIPSRLHVRGGGRGIEAPYWLIERCTTALKATDIFFLVRGNENQIFRSGLTGESTAIEPFLAAGYPALSLEGEYEPLSLQEGKTWLSSFDRFLQAFLVSFRQGIPETWDRHYLFFQMRGFYFSISEKSYLLLLLLLLGGVLLYALLFTRRIKKYRRTLLKNLWSLPLFILTSFLLLGLSTWLLEGVLYLRNMTRLWTWLPLPFLALKLMVPVSILAMAITLLKKIPFSRNGSFYSAAAILFLLFDVLLLAVINISFTYYFLWALAFTLLFAASPNKWLKLLFFLASPYWILKTVVELFSLPELEFCRLLLFSKIGGNLLLTLTLLPWVMMFIRLKLILPFPRRFNPRTRATISLAACSTLAAALLVILFVYPPFNRQNKQSIRAQYLIHPEESRYTLRLSSSASLGKLYLWDEDQVLNLDSRSRSFTLPIREVPDPLRTQLTSTGFLDRKNIDLIITPEGQPVRVKLSLDSPEEFVLFDSNFPSLRAASGREYQILIGAHPPVPLTVQLTLPKDRSFEITVILEYYSPPEGYALFGRYKRFSILSTFEKRLKIKT